MHGKGRAHVATELGHRASTSPPGGSDRQPGSSPGTESRRPMSVESWDPSSRQGGPGAQGPRSAEPGAVA